MATTARRFAERREAGAPTRSSYQEKLRSEVEEAVACSSKTKTKKITSTSTIFTRGARLVATGAAEASQQNIGSPPMTFVIKTDFLT